MKIEFGTWVYKNGSPYPTWIVTFALENQSYAAMQEISKEIIRDKDYYIAEGCNAKLYNDKNAEVHKNKEVHYITAIHPTLAKDCSNRGT